MKKAIIPALIAATAVARAGMAGLPNVEPVMLGTVVAGTKYGWKYGALTGLLSMLISDFIIYGTIPLFLLFGTGIFLVSLSTNLSYGLAGALSAFAKPRTRKDFALLAAELTVLYDFLTNVAWGLITGIPIPAALVAGIPFSLVHVASNAIIVGIIAPWAIAALTAAETGIFASKPSPAEQKEYMRE